MKLKLMVIVIDNVLQLLQNSKIGSRRSQKKPVFSHHHHHHYSNHNTDPLYNISPQQNSNSLSLSLSENLVDWASMDDCQLNPVVTCSNLIKLWERRCFAHSLKGIVFCKYDIYKHSWEQVIMQISWGIWIYQGVKHY